LGEKLVRHINMLEGVEIGETGTKDEVAIQGNDIEAVSQSAASIHTSCLVKNKGVSCVPTRHGETLTCAHRYP
jgi:large subunit ribosomal protein L9e